MGWVSVLVAFAAVHVLYASLQPFDDSSSSSFFSMFYYPSTYQPYYTAVVAVQCSVAYGAAQEILPRLCRRLPWRKKQLAKVSSVKSVGYFLRCYMFLMIL